MKFPALALILILLGAQASAGWQDGTGRAMPDTKDMRSAGPLLVRLTITPDEQEMRRVWTAGAANPLLRTTDSTTLGSEVTAVVIFQGCTAAASGKCDLAVEFSLVTPSGKKVSGGQASVWAAAPLAGKFMLGAGRMALAFRPQDESGTYQIHARVTDRVASRTLDLMTPLRVGAA
jgi:hypothetical protein